MSAPLIPDSGAAGETAQEEGEREIKVLETNKRTHIVKDISGDQHSNV